MSHHSSFLDEISGLLKSVAVANPGNQSKWFDVIPQLTSKIAQFLYRVDPSAKQEAVNVETVRATVLLLELLKDEEIEDDELTTTVKVILTISAENLSEVKKGEWEFIEKIALDKEGWGSINLAEPKYQKIFATYGLPSSFGRVDIAYQFGKKEEPQRVIEPRQLKVISRLVNTSRKAALISWLVIIIGIVISIINNPVAQGIGGSIWLLGVVMQFIIGFLFFTKKKNHSSESV